MKFAFGAGGTGGHIVPALALIKQLQAKGHECIMIGNSLSMEERMAHKAGLPFFPIKVQKLYRGFKPGNLLFPYYLFGSVLRSGKILSQQKVDGVITTGGFVAGPVAIAAIRKKLPCFLHESNSFPGLTTKHLARHLQRLYISFEDTRRHIQGSNLKNFGIPILPQIPGEETDLAKFGLQTAKPTILVTGGSQGSLAINSAISSLVSLLLDDDWQILWQTGSRTYQKFSQQYKGKKGLHIFDFSNELPAMMRAADLAITRAGALTIAELEASALPAILIPLPTAAENHQYHNALAQKNKGVAELINQTDLSPQTLLSVIKTMDRHLMRERLHQLPPNTAAEQIANDILSFF